MAQQKIFGYADRLSVRPGEEIAFHVNADGTNEAAAHLVRLIHGDTHEAGPGHIEEEIDHPVNGTWTVKKQFTQLGSYLEVDDPTGKLAQDGSITIMGYVWPTLSNAGRRQTIMGRWDTLRNKGYAIGINPAGNLEFWVGDGKEVDYVTGELPILPHVWYFVAATFDLKTGKAELYQEGVVNRYNSLYGRVVPDDYATHVVQKFRFRHVNGDGIPFIIGGALDAHELRGTFVNDLYAGKVDRPAICKRVLSRAELDSCRGGAMPPADSILAYWDTAAGYTANGIGHLVVDVGPHGLHAKGVNHPVRGMTGWNWNGKDDCFRLAPEQYGGIEFHPDTVTDCRLSLIHI